MHSCACTHPTSGKITQNVSPTEHERVAFGGGGGSSKNRPLTFRRDSAMQARE